MKKPQSFLRLPAVAAGLAATLLAGPVLAAIEFDQDVTPVVGDELIYGSGNANGSFTTDRAGDLELGLKAKLRFDGSCQPQNTFNSNGDGTYSFAAGNKRASCPGLAAWWGDFIPEWSFDFAVNTDRVDPVEAVLGDFTYELGMDLDPGLGTNFLTFDPIIGPCFDHSTGNNSTTKNTDTVRNCGSPDAANYAGDLSTNNVAQNSWNYAFFDDIWPQPFDPAVPGTYTIYLQASDGDGVVARTEIQILVGGAPPVISPVVNPVSYDMPNGARGSYTYHDDSYSGNGSNTVDCAPLTDGLGDLTDGIVTLNELTGQVASYPWVGWRKDLPGCSNPTITFDFAGPTSFDSVTLYMFDRNGGGSVDLPPTIQATVGVNAPRVFFIANPPGYGTAALTLDLDGDIGEEVELVLSDAVGSLFVFATEVVFSGDVLPVANDDTATVLEDASATSIDVLANDSNPDGGPMVIASVTQPGNGSVVNNGTDLTYEPDADYCNDGDPTDDFTYTLNGGSTATVEMTVTCVNDKPDFTVADVTKNEDSGEHLNVPVTVVPFDPGAANETGQTVIACNLSNFDDPNTPVVLTGAPSASVNGTDDGCVITFDTNLNNYGGNITFDLQIQDSGGTANGGVDLSDAKSVTITIDPVNDAPYVESVTAAAQTVQYSDDLDEVTIVVRDVDSEGTTLTLATDGEPNAINDAVLVAGSCQAWPVDHPYTGDGRECTFTMNGQVLVPGDNDHVITFTPNDTETDGSTGTHTLSVVPEGAAVYLDNEGDANPTAIEVVDSEADPTNPAFTMFFWAYERNTHPFGDLADIGDPNGSPNAVDDDFTSTNVEGTITFSAVGPGGGHSQACDATDYPSSGDDSEYSDYMVFQCDIPAGVLDVNTYEVEAKVDGYGPLTRYFYGIDEDAFVVFDPNAGFTTGGGWFYFPDTAIEEGACLILDPEDLEEPFDCLVFDPCAAEPGGYPGDKTNFGFTMKYNKKATNIQGSALVMRHTMIPVEIEPGDWRCLEGGNYRVKSNALFGLALSESESEPPYGYASFAGKATYREPGLDNEGNHTFIIYVEDYGDQGCGQDPDMTDRFWIEVWDKDDIRVLDPGMGFNGAEYAEDIECGNIVVPFSSGGGGGGHGKGKGNKGGG